MIDIINEKRLLQFTIALVCLVPLSAGLMGILEGTQFIAGDSINMDSHFRYMSGLLLGISLGFLSAIRNIEHHTMRIRLLTIIVVIGGCGRLVGIFLFINSV